MRKHLKAMVMLSAALLICPVAFGAEPVKKIVNITVRGQERRYWCWAACSEMALRVVSPDDPNSFLQCIQARKNPLVRFAPSDTCCGTEPICDARGWPVFEQFGCKSVIPVTSPLTWDELKSNCDGNRPVVFAIRFLDDSGVQDGGHMLCVYGYQESDTEKLLYVVDPEPVAFPASDTPEGKRGASLVELTYDEYANGSKPPHRFGKRLWPRIAHWKSYPNLQVKAPGGTSDDSTNAYDVAADKDVGKHFAELRAQLTEAMGPGGDQNAIVMEPGITFREIPLKALAAQAAPGGQTEQMFKGGAKFIRIYPVVDNSSERTISGLASMWKDGDAISFSKPTTQNVDVTFERQIVEAKRKFVAEHGLPTGGFSGFIFRGVNRAFLRAKVDNVDYLVPIEYDPSLNLTPGKGVRLNELVERIAPEAQRRAVEMEVP